MRHTMKPRFIIAAITLTLLLPAASLPVHAIEGDRARFDQCRQLKSANQVNWHGIASGTIDSTFAIFENSRSFHTKACFATERQCQNWVKRIWWEIPTMDELQTAYCKPA